MLTKEMIKMTISSLISLLNQDVHSNYESKAIADTEYIIGLTKRPLEVHLWAGSGRTALFYKSDFNYFDSVIDSLIDEIFEVIQDKENGIIRCSDCSKKILIDKIAGRYFAGVYCKECWDSTWKAIEARETYD